MSCGEFNRAVGLTAGPTILSRGSSISSLGNIRICIRITTVKIEENESLNKVYLSIEEVVSAGRSYVVVRTRGDY